MTKAVVRRFFRATVKLIRIYISDRSQILTDRSGIPDRLI